MIEALDLDLTVRMTGGEVRLRVTDADLSNLTGSVQRALAPLVRCLAPAEPAPPAPVAPAPAPAARPTPGRQATKVTQDRADAILGDLIANGPVHDPSGRAVTLLFDRAGIDALQFVRRETMNRLQDRGLIEQRRSKTRTYWIAAIGHGDGTEPAPVEKARKVTPAPAPARRARCPGVAGPAIEGRTAEKAPPTPAVAPVSHQGYRVVEVLEETDIDVAQVSEDERRQRATEGAWPEDFLK